jgi:hypothetical protein
MQRSMVIVHCEASVDAALAEKQMLLTRLLQVLLEAVPSKNSTGPMYEWNFSTGSTDSFSFMRTSSESERL